jgi:GNAT superfamily N-acetyltransferase
LVRELARYERLEHEVVSDTASFQKVLKDPHTKVEVLLAFHGPDPAGFALYFENFSTFLGRPGLFLEDLYVQPDKRRLGIGTALFAELFAIARRRHYGRVEWNVLDWNEPAIRFYTERIGARILREWRTCRVVLGEAESGLGV